MSAKKDGQRGDRLYEKEKGETDLMELFDSDVDNLSDGFIKFLIGLQK